MLDIGAETLMHRYEAIPAKLLLDPHTQRVCVRAMSAVHEWGTQREGVLSVGVGM